MTVIAWDTKILAADSRATGNGGTTLISDRVRKLHALALPKPKREIVLGACGCLGGIGPWLAHLAKNGITSLSLADEDCSMSALAVDRQGECTWLNTDGLWHPVDFPTAIGSGSDIVEHYLLKGVSAVDSIRECYRTELTCGGPIIAYDFVTNTFTEYPA